MATTIDEVLEIADPNSFSIAISDLVAQSPRSLADLRPAERVVWCVSELEREVNNGGFVIFFMNSAGDLASETVDALETVGAHRVASLLREAMAVFPPPGPATNRTVREAQVEALPDTATETWNRLDEQFFRYPDDLSGLLRAHVAAHKADFQ